MTDQSLINVIDVAIWLTASLTLRDYSFTHYRITLHQHKCACPTLWIIKHFVSQTSASMQSSGVMSCTGSQMLGVKTILKKCDVILYYTLHIKQYLYYFNTVITKRNWWHVIWRRRAEEQHLMPPAKISCIDSHCCTQPICEKWSLLQEEVSMRRREPTCG